MRGCWFDPMVIRWRWDRVLQPCNQCGKCCIHYADGGLVATAEEIDRWEADRPDIFAYVKEGQIWHSPETGQPLSRCPWLVGREAPYSCAIYADRPEDCRSYPSDLTDMVRDGCEMLEAKDLKDQKKALVRLLELQTS